ncbi:MAG TPA: SRPBCC family protein [Thermoleophilaceae bacterium]|jgi:uncharacterized protein YndB with AHSA1/START domain
MPTVSRRGTVPAERSRVWEVVSDPYHLPRWWPRVDRVEEASPEAWTTVMHSSRGKAVRADYTRIDAEPPRVLRWRHEVAESPFEGVFAESTFELELEPDGEDATRVRLTAEQRLTGKSRFGTRMVRRATRRQLDGALEGLRRAFGGDS